MLTFFVKYKHRNTLLYPFEQKVINGERTVIIPAIYNSKNPSIATPVIVNKRIYEFYKIILDNLSMISKDIIERTILYIETGGSLLIEYYWFDKLKKMKKSLHSKLLKSID